MLTLILTLAKNVEQSGVLKVTFVDYVNPGKKDYAGGNGDKCCDKFNFATIVIRILRSAYKLLANQLRAWPIA